MTSAREARLAMRQGKWTGPTVHKVKGYIQANLVVIPRVDAYEFLVYCQRNAKACPVIEITDPGDPESLLAMTSIVKEPLGPEGSSVTITWQSVAGKIYIIEYCDDPYSETMIWNMCDALMAEGPESSWTDVGDDRTGWVNPDDAPRRYYRVEIYVP